jgi:enoyl-CoA hydratase/carnithine racemase
VTEAPSVLVEARGPVVVITLNRPERLNAWTLEMEQRYLSAVLAADADPGVRAIVVTGAGRGFSAGADMSLLETVTGSDEAEQARVRAELGPGALLNKLDLLAVRKPLIAAINGPCVGLGLIYALYCDLRFADSDAKLGTAFAKRGLVAEYGTAVLLPDLVGTSRALDLLMSARLVSGEEAFRLGLVDRSCSPGTVLDEALAYAGEMVAQCSPTSIAIMKRQLIDARTETLEQAHDKAVALMAESFARPDAAEGVASWLEKRPPAFPPLG